MTISHSNTLLVILMLSSVLLCVAAASVILALKFRKYRSRPYLFASCLFLLQTLGIGTFLCNPVLNDNIDATFDTILRPSTIILGFITIIFVSAYIVEIKRPGMLTVKSLLLYTSPFTVASAFMILLHTTPIRNLNDLSDNISRPDVILRLALISLFVVYPILVACQPYEWRQCLISKKSVIVLQALLCVVSPLFVAGITCGFFPAVIANYVIAIVFDAIVAYIELKIRIPVPEKQEVQKANETRKRVDLSIIDNPEIWMNPDLTVTELAGMIGTNRTYLWNQIKDLGYQSFTDMINRKRVEYICQELENGTDKNIISLMFDAGFRSRSTASREFKRIKECTPSEYLESIARP